MGTELDRPSALTPEIQKEIVRLLARGASLYSACYVAGTTYDAVNYWRKLCESKANHAQVYTDFFESIKRAQSLTEVNAAGAILDGDNNWQSRAWFLERRFPKRWAARPKAEKQVGKTLPELVAEAEKIAEELERDRRRTDAGEDAGQEPE